MVVGYHSAFSGENQDTAFAHFQLSPHFPVDVLQQIIMAHGKLGPLAFLRGSDERVGRTTPQPGPAPHTVCPDPLPGSSRLSLGDEAPSLHRPCTQLWTTCTQQVNAFPGESMFPGEELWRCEPIGVFVPLRTTKAILLQAGP